MAFITKDITNKKYNLLTAIRFIEKRKLGKQIYHFWEFRCDCGNLKVLNKNTVTSGGTKSCGCLHKKNVFKKEKGFANFIHTYYYYKASAKKRNLEFALNKEQFFNLTQKNCHYCAAPPSNKMSDKNCNGEFIYNGIDRVDNNLGYFIENCIACCKTCNIAKRDLALNDFMSWIKRVYENNFIWTLS